MGRLKPGGDSLPTTRSPNALHVGMEPAQRTNSAASSARSFLTRTLTRRGTDRDDSSTPKGPLGLTTLYQPDPVRSAVADLVFVHGLNGGSRSTWSKGNMPSHFWPQEWLPKDSAFEDVRIHTFGYPAALSRESSLNVYDFARSLLAAVKDSPTMNQGDKVRACVFHQRFRMSLFPMLISSLL
jgi:hypothetical protein